MATHYQIDTSKQNLQHAIQQHFTDSNDVNLLTQLSTDDSYDSPPTTSAWPICTWPTNTNLNGKLLFPLAEKAKNTTKHFHKMSCYDLLKYLKSQQIVENIEIFKKMERKQSHDVVISCEQFPLEAKQMPKDKFPCQKDVESYFEYHNSICLKRKEVIIKKRRVSLKISFGKRTFPYNRKGFKLKLKNSKNQQFNSKLKQRLKLKRRTLRKSPIQTNSTINPFLENIKINANIKFPLQEEFSAFYTKNEKVLKFPQNIFESRPESKTGFNRTQQLKQLLEDQYDVNLVTTDPCELCVKSQLATHCSPSTFPIRNPNTLTSYTQLEYPFENDHNNYCKLSNSKNSKANNVSFPSLSMTPPNGQKMKYLDNEHVCQVQDAQVHVKENPLPLAMENKQPPPQAAIAKAIYNDHDDFNMLADINSINNNIRPNEVGYYAEKIERLQDTIVALFERIKNSLKTNHNSQQGSTKAAKHEYGDENIRFALTPPMSVTSVRNAQRNDSKEFVFEKYDLDDLCDRPFSQIVECSDVRDTLAETVDNGVIRKPSNSTGGFLVKSEEPTSPSSLSPKSLDESGNTSFKNLTNASELLPQSNELTVNDEFNVDVKNNLKCESFKEIVTLTREAKETVVNTQESNLTSVEVNEVTVPRSTGIEQENTKEKNHLQYKESLEHKNNNLCNDLEIDEMKFEMNRVKGALPSSIAERSMGKHDNLLTENNKGNNSTRLSVATTLGQSRLPNSLSSTRSHKDSSYTSRSALKNESSSLANTVPKRSTLSTHLTQGDVTNRSIISTPSLNESITSRTALNSMQTSNDANSDRLAHHRPSLGSLRNAQSTSLLSTDLPRYTPLRTLNQTDQTTSVNRAVSIDSSLGDALPERTRLRRQRRLRTQNSEDEPEDPIERLNRLKARISASLSEVKGVLKQYSTEAENENQTAPTANNAREHKEDEKKEGPITFRFVKKVRRRSLFAEDDEEEQKETKANAELPKENTEHRFERPPERNDETDNCKLINEPIQAIQSSEIKQVYDEKSPLENLNKEDLKKIEQLPLKEMNLYSLKEEVQESLEGIPPTITETEKEILENNEINETSEDKQQTLKEEGKGAIPKTSVKLEINQLDSDLTHEARKKTKKKLIIKSKDPFRRASLAAVEGSKIEPAIKEEIPTKIQRRPSDSQAVVKKKLITVKLKASGAVEEVTPKPKIVKAKRSSIKTNASSQLATTQSKIKEDEPAIDKSDDHVKPIDKENKSIHTDKTENALLPKQPEQQNQINTEITRQTNLLLPTQLVIDEAASLNKKTIENSMLPPSQQQQQQRQQDQQATIESTATNFISNDLQANGAMLENVTTVLSSSIASESNGQIKSEKVVEQEFLHDLLQQETTIIKSSATNKQNELNLLNQVEDHKSEVKDSITKQASAKNTSGNLESPQITTKEQQQQQKTTTQYQQVIETAADVIHGENNDTNKHEDFKAKASCKEPCEEQTTSKHVATEYNQQQQQQQHQLLVEDEQSLTNVEQHTKTISSPHISISCTPDIAHKTTTASLLPTEEEAEVSANQPNTMPEQQLAPAPVQTAHIISHPEEHHKKKIIIRKIVRQSSVDKTKKKELEIKKPTQEAAQVLIEPPPSYKSKATEDAEEVTVATPSEPALQDELTEECSESTEISESSTSVGSEEAAAAQTPKKERKVKKKVIIKREKRRLSISDSFFHSGSEDASQNADIETLEKPIAYVSDDEDDQVDENSKEAKDGHEAEQENKPLKSCILHKEYNIGDEVLYAERFKKTQIKWRRGRVKERITSISYLLDIDGKDVSSHINYLKKFTGRKVSFGGKEYLEIDYEQLAEEEEKAERLQRRTYSIWNMV